MERIEIALSKKKTALMILGSILFVAASLFLLLVAADNQTRFDPLLVKAASIFGILFFGATTIYGFIKIVDKKAGLIIDKHGIYDNSGGTSIGLIAWEDITEIKVEEVSSTRFLLIYTTKSKSYINKSKGLKKRLMQMNYKMYGTPLSISSNGLKCSFNQLEKLIRDRLNEVKQH